MRTTTFCGGIEAVEIDQQEGLIAGTDDIGTKIIGGPLMSVEEFVNANRTRFVKGSGQ